MARLLSTRPLVGFCGALLLFLRLGPRDRLYHFFVRSPARLLPLLLGVIFAGSGVILYATHNGAVRTGGRFRLLLARVRAAFLPASDLSP